MSHLNHQLAMFGEAPGARAKSKRQLPPLAEHLDLIADRLALNQQQLAVVTAPFGPMLVIAGAGSGKTNVLVRRAAWFIAHGIPPKQILCITFTRKASHEMLSRIQELNLLQKQKVQGGTFHSKANHWLRIHGSAIGLSSKFSLMDEDDSSGMLYLLASKQRLTSIKGFPDKRALLSIFCFAANSLAPIDETIENTFPQFSPYTAQIIALHRLFADTKWTQQRFDYDDLLLMVHRLLMEQPEAAERLRAQYQAILVDEYQDSTRIQSELVRLLGAGHHNVMVVGDDSQSIYGFRAADVRNMHDFVQLFPNVHIHKLEHNYRSTGAILHCANQILTHAQGIHPKQLFTTKPPGRHPQLAQCDDEHLQSEYIIQQIRGLQEQGVGLHRIAVLFRLSAHSYDLETALTRHRIPFLKYGGLALVETAHVKDFLAYLTVSLRPNDRLSWQRLLLLVDRVTPAIAEMLIQTIKQATNPLDVLRHDTSTASHDLGTLAAVLTQLNDPAIPLGLRLRAVLDHYYTHLKRHYQTDMHERLNELGILIESHATAASVDEMLDSLVGTGHSTRTQIPSHPDNTLVLSTIHSAKGLEWDAVFLINAMDGRLPHQRSFKSPEALEEERRLLYVAITRPRHFLTITYPVNIYPGSGTPIAGKCCRFLDVLDEQTVERIILS